MTKPKTVENSCVEKLAAQRGCGKRSWRSSCLPRLGASAVVLLSGGLDSATAAAWGSVVKNFTLFALTIDYHQRHRVEIEAARRVAKSLAVKEHLEISVDLHLFGGSTLTISDGSQNSKNVVNEKIVKDKPLAAIGAAIPSTYVPARNTIFLSLALAMAETRGAANIIIGANAVDYSGYPDCREPYLQAFEKMAVLATKAGCEGEKFTIHAPLLQLSKAEIIRVGSEWGVDYSLTHSCYDPSEKGISCGRCESCTLRRAGFAAAQIDDPIQYNDHCNPPACHKNECG